MSYKLNDNINAILDGFREKTKHSKTSTPVYFLYDFLEEKEKIELINEVEKDSQISNEIKFSFLNDIITMPNTSADILSAIEVIARNKKKSEAATLLYKTVYHMNYVGNIFDIRKDTRALKEKEPDILDEKKYYVQPKYSFFNLKNKNVTIDFCINLLNCFESIKYEEMKNEIMKNSLAHLSKAQEELQQQTQQTQEVVEIQNNLNNCNNALDNFNNFNKSKENNLPSGK